MSLASAGQFTSKFSGVGRIEKLLWLPPVMQEVSGYVCSDRVRSSVRL